MSNTLTPRQLETLMVIDRSIREEGFPPTHREIALALGMSVYSNQAVAEHIGRLEQKGMVRRRPQTSRGLVLTDAARELLAQQGAVTP